MGSPVPGTSSTHPYKYLYGLGAGNTCGAAGDILSDNAEGASRVLATVVLGPNKTVLAKETRTQVPTPAAKATPLDRKCSAFLHLGFKALTQTPSSQVFCCLGMVMPYKG